MNDNIDIIKDQMDDLTDLLRQYTRHKTGSIASKHKGFPVLFYGVSGSGKTMAANFFAKNTGKEILRIDLSHGVSKYIGETEKNLSKIFENAVSKGLILFFDEADALFGKRTQIKDSHDKYANQEISYFFELLEGYLGIAIISTTSKPILDSKTKRKFRAIIQFHK